MNLHRMKSPSLAVLILILGVITGCDHFPFSKKDSSQTAKTAEQESQRLPTASEVFHLRTACSEFGVKIMNENFIGRALTQDQVSHYDPKTNRCYVQLTVQSADMSGKFFASYLYDGQTKEMLAFIQKKEGEKTFMNFKAYPNETYDQVNSYMYSKMEDKDYSK